MTAKNKKYYEQYLFNSLRIRAVVYSLLVHSPGPILVYALTPIV